VRRRRGYVIVPVLILGVVFLLAIETSLTLLMTGLRDSRRREASLDARQLALSGLDWGEACVASRRAGCGDVLLLPGGEAAVRVEAGPIEATVRAEGRILRNGKLLASQTLSRRVPRPEEREPGAVELAPPIEPAPFIEPPPEPAPDVIEPSPLD
jgi:hypothetical protein